LGLGWLWIEFAKAKFVHSDSDENNRELEKGKYEEAHYTCGYGAHDRCGERECRRFVRNLGGA
jgi:hypothetical protein